MSPEDKLGRLEANLKSLGKVLVTFSGGVDSTFLAAVATKVLGENCFAVTAVSQTMARREREAVVSIGQQLGLQDRHFVLTSNELTRPGFAENPTNRCAHCKAELFDVADPLAKKLGISAILLGTNTNDLGDYRPGIAEAKKRGALAPMVDADLSKDEIRSLSKAMGLSTWNKPQLACLSSRFPYGTTITESNLKQVDGLEELLVELGFSDLRVRYHGDVARIEVPKHQLALAVEHSDRIVTAAKRFGFTYAALDLQGFRSGSLNESLIQIKRN